jgi:excisionase family DNA binding protein
MLTVDEAAAQLAVSAKTVRRRIDDGQLPVFRSGRIVRVREDDLRRYVAQRTARSRAVAPAVRRGRVLASKLWEPIE